MANEVKKNEVQNTQAAEGTKGQETPKDQKPKKPNIFKRAWEGVKSGFKAVRESPQAAVIGAAVGSLATIGIGAYIEHKIGGSYVQGSLPEPDDGIEIEDTGEEYMEGPSDEDDGE